MPAERRQHQMLTKGMGFGAFAGVHAGGVLELLTQAYRLRTVEPSFAGGRR